MIVLEINNLVKARFNKNNLIVLARRTGQKLKIKGRKTVSLVLVGLAISRALNKEYRGLDQPTDVLSFGQSQLADDRNFLGEIVICWPLTERQAPAYRVSVQAELGRLLVHGLLHLTGRHHQTAWQRRRMERLTTAILSK